LEIGGEYADGDALAAAMLVTIGATIACRRASRQAALPPALRGDRACRSALGWYGRSAFGSDLYTEGRPFFARAATITAAEHLRRCVAIAQRARRPRRHRSSRARSRRPTRLPPSSVDRSPTRRPPAANVHGDVVGDIVRPLRCASWRRDLVAFSSPSGRADIKVGRPTTALPRRSPERRNRWVGPTQPRRGAFHRVDADEASTGARRATPL
jgi:hypothetical protein